MRDADQNLVRAASRRELHRFVEHRHEDVEPLDRELLLADERAPKVRLERLDPSQALEEATAVVVGESRPETTRLDRLPKPDALGVIRDVLDLVGDRARVDLLEVRERLEQRALRARRDGAVGPECVSGAPASAEAPDASRRAPGRPSAPSRADRAGRSGGRASGTPSRATSRPRPLPSGRSSGAWRAAVSGCSAIVVTGGAGPPASAMAWSATLPPFPDDGGRPSSSSADGSTEPSPSLSNSSRHAGSTASGLSRYCSRSCST